MASAESQPNRLQRGWLKRAAWNRENKISVSANNWHSTERYPYSRPPGFAAIRSATSFWTRNSGACRSCPGVRAYRETMGVATYYGRLPTRTPGAPLRPVDFEGIGFENFEARFAAMPFAKILRSRRNRARIGNDPICACEQVFGQRAAPRPDLHCQRRVFPASGFGDPIECLTFNEKVLSEFRASHGMAQSRTSIWLMPTRIFPLTR